MILLKPCYLYHEILPITFHRKLIVMLMIFDLCLLLVFRLLSIFFRNDHKQRVDDILRRGVLQKDMIRVEEINVNSSEKTGANGQEQNSQATIKGAAEQAKEREQNEGSESSSSSDSSARNQQGQPEPTSSQKYLIELKRLRMTESQLRDTYCIHLGHKFICLGVSILYYPFAIASAIAITQTIIKIAYYICKICGAEGKLCYILNGSALMMNLPMLLFAIYGIATRVPQVNGQYCFDL